MTEENNAIIYIEHDKVREVYFNGRTIPTMKDVEVPWSDAMKLSRLGYFKTIIKNIRTTSRDYDPALFRDKKIYGFTADADTESGFGNCTTNLLRQSIKNGYDVRWIGRANNVTDLNYLSGKVIPPNIGMVWHEQPNGRWDQTPFDVNIAVTPFETTVVPASWVPRLNKFNGVMVPCSQNVSMMRDSGVTVPIKQIAWGVDPNLFHYVPREDDGLFTFGTNGALTRRKGTDKLVNAFVRAFPAYGGNYKDVRLICKTSRADFQFMPSPKDARVIVLGVHCQDHQDVMAKYYAKIDVGIYPFTGEGFGMCPLECMAVGRPSVVTGWSGPMDYVTPETSWLLPYDMVPALDFQLKTYHEYCGDWASVPEDALVEMLRYLYNHRDEVKQKGEAAAKYVAEQWTWDKKIGLYFDALTDFLK